MNPYKLKNVFEYLTSNNQLLKKKLKLGTSEIPIPPKRDDVTTIEAINRFNKANPRVDTTNLKPLSVKQSNVKKPDEAVVQDAVSKPIITLDPEKDSFKKISNVLGAYKKYRRGEKNPKLNFNKFFELYSTENFAEGGRIGYKDGPKLTDFLNVQASGSKTGKNQITGAPEGITADSETINAIIKADIPVSEKINLLATYGYGKGRTRIENKDQEIFLDEGGYRDRNVGIDFNRDGDGFSGSANYGIDTGEPQLNIKYKKSFADGGMLVQPSDDGSRPGYKKDNPGSVYKDNNGYSVRIGAYNNPNQVQGYFGAKKYGSLEKAKEAAEKFRKKEAKNFEFAPQGPQTGKQAATEKAIQELLDEGTEVSTAAVKEKLPKNLQKDFSSNKSYFSKAKKNFPDLDFKRKSSWFIKTPKDIAAVKKLIEDGLPLKEIQAKGYDVGFIKRVASTNELKIAETSREYFENMKKVSNDLTKIGTNKKIVGAFENGTVSKDLINQVGKVTKSGDPFYDSRLLFKLAEYYDGSLEEWYKPKLPKPTANQLANSDKVIKSSSTFLGGKRNGYAYQNFLYDWGAKKIDQVLDLPLGTFRGIQRDIAKTLPSGISLDEVFGVKSSGRFAPIEGILTNPLESGANVDKGSFVDNIKSNYQKQLIDAAGDSKKQKEILKDYNDIVEKSKVRYPDVEFPDYKVGQPPNKTIKGFSNLPPLIQNKLLENYKTTGISPVTKKAVSIFDVAKATGSKTFTKLDEATQTNLSNMSSKQEQKILQNIQSYSKLPQCKVGAADGGRIGFAYSDECVRDGLKEQKIEAQKGNKKAAQELVQVGKVATRAGLLRNLLGPGAILSELVYEGAVMANKILGGTPKDIAWAESYLSYLDPRKYTPEGLDPLKMRREDMITREDFNDPDYAEGESKTIDGPNANILRSGFAAQDQVSAFNEAVNEKLRGERANRFDIANRAAADVREQGRFVDQSKDIISSDAFQEASKQAQEYIQSQTGENMFPYNQLKQSIGKYESGEARDLRGEREKEMQALGGTYLDYKNPFTKDEYENFARKEGYLPIDKAYTDKYFTEAILNPMKFEQLMETPGFKGASNNFASGGIASLTKTIPPESGPTPQGLPYVYNNVKKI